MGHREGFSSFYTHYGRLIYSHLISISIVESYMEAICSILFVLYRVNIFGVPVSIYNIHFVFLC